MTSPYAVWHPFVDLACSAEQLTTDHVREQLIVVESGTGAWVLDEQGRRHLNCTNAANIVGLGRSEVAERCAAQLRRLSFFPLFAGTHPLANELGEALRRIVPPQFRLVAFSNDGSGAVETALKMARQYFVMTGQPQRQALIGLARAYHGVGYGALSLTDLGLHPLYQPMLPDCFTVPAPHPYRPPFAGEPSDVIGACVAALEERITSLDPGRVAAVIVEPVQGLGGIVPLPPEYLLAVRALTRRHGILLIADEVTTGFGRLGSWFAGTRWPIDADIMAVAKGLTGGYVPMGATLATAEIYDAFTGLGFPHGWTTSGHPAGCAAALAVLDILEREDLVRNAERVGAMLLNEIRWRLAYGSHVGDVRGLGLMIGIELVEDRSTKAPARPEFTRRFTRALREVGVLALAVEGVLALYPPLTLTEDEADELATRLVAAFNRTEAQLVG